MKLRKGFVSNSSTTSFTCDVCGEEVSGMDMGLSEAQMRRCVGGHLYCEEHSHKNYEKELTKESVIDYISGLKYYYPEEKVNEIKQKLASLSQEEFEDWAWQGEGTKITDGMQENGEMASVFCAVCNMEILTQDMTVDYLAKTTGITRDEVFRMIKQENKRRKKLHAFEYISYVTTQKNITIEDVYKEVKDRFKTYEEFHTFIYG